MILYHMPLHRPPPEGNNLVIQVTYGCSFNECSFCSMYKSKQYSVRPLDDIFGNHGGDQGVIIQRGIIKPGFLCVFGAHQLVRCHTKQDEDVF